MKSILVECKDKNCPVHGTLKVRGAVFVGRVISAKATQTAIIEIPRVVPVRKYERLEKRRSKLHVHIPHCMRVQEGQTIKAAECRKISKTKSHVMIS